MSSDNLLFLIRDRDKHEAYLVNDISKHGSDTVKIRYMHPNGRTYAHTFKKQDVHGRIVDVKGRFVTMAEDVQTVNKEKSQVNRLNRGTVMAMMSANLPKPKPLSTTRGSPNTRKKNPQPTRMNQVSYPSPTSHNGGRKTKPAKKAHKK